MLRWMSGNTRTDQTKKFEVIHQVDLILFGDILKEG